MSVNLPRQSLEYLLFPITTSPVDASTLSHEVAVTDTDAQPSTWVPASYASGRVRVLVRASADAPVGGDVETAVGRWRLWWRASSNPEFPVRSVGVFHVV